ncbi:MAG: protein phosphatase 2C domain-containing protein [Acutalibacteraceae bacterium]|nr:protein phosphatase 2C domain-containing protein [Acutalibacteraceae bacterium]
MVSKKEKIWIIILQSQYGIYKVGVYMQSYNENDLKLYFENSLYDFVAYTTIGEREEQQDSFGFDMQNSALLAILCDGMGGHNGGAAASKTAVNYLMEKLNLHNTADSIPRFFLNVLRNTDIKVSSLADEKGNLLGAGTTVAAVLLLENNLFWCSVGDSRIYLIRGNEMIQATCDHTYKLVLDKQLANGEISPEEYERDISSGNALVSFLGAGDLPMTDINQEPFKLIEDDIIVITSDGLYKYLSDNDIKNIIGNFSDLNDAVEALDAKVRRGSKIINLSRDNMTTIIIRIKRNV